MSLIISKIKLVVTTECNMSCDYCMIKNTHDYMNFDLAKKYIDSLIFGTKSNILLKKYLYFFGGEPILNFFLIKKVVNYVNNKKKNYNFDVQFVLCTNFTLVDENILLFIKNNNIKLSISIGGNENLHNKHRVFNNKNINSFLILKNNLDKINKINIPKENIGVGLVLYKPYILNLYSNFLYIINNLNLIHFNIEIIISKESWEEKDYILFKLEYLKIIKYIISNIYIGNYIYLNSLNWSIVEILTGYKKFDKNNIYENLLEVYPNGDLLVSGFYTHLSENKNYKLSINKMEFQYIENIIDFSLLDNFNPGKSYYDMKTFLNIIDKKISMFIYSLSLKNSFFKKYIESVMNIYF